jgi:hypothetical protein
MEELVTDMIFQNIEYAGERRPGKANLEVMSSSFSAEQLLFCSTG